ncbi:MAG: cation transporter [Gemmataceae bacterium]|nr:cation transporter [Gemmataceae bacterium]
MGLFHPRNALYLSVLAGISTIAIKTGAFLISGSVGLLSDAAESVINLVAATLAICAMRFSEKPADKSHTYGHDKIAYFSSGFEGALILIASLGIACLAFHRFIFPKPIETLNLAMALSLAGALINGAVGFVLLRLGRKTKSIVLEADGKHLVTDVITTAGVLAGLTLQQWTGQAWLDPAIALLVAVNILYLGLELIWKSFKGLMDHALPEKEVGEIRDTIARLIGPDMAFHALRSRHSGAKKFVDFHLLIPGSWLVLEAHSLMEKLEGSIRELDSDIEVQIHAEPIEDPKSWQDQALLKIE